MARQPVDDADRCAALTLENVRCKQRRLEGYDTCRRHTDENWEGRCAALVTSRKRQCRKDAVKGSTVCGSHGAGSPHKGRPSGSKSLALNRPRLQRALAPELGRRYERAFNDPTLLSLRSNIALSETLLYEAMETLSDGSSLKQWEDLRKTAEKLQGALIVESEALIRRYSMQLVDTINRGADQRQARKEINIQQEYIRKLKDSEWKKLRDMKQMVTVEEANALLNKVVVGFHNVTRLFTARLGPDHIKEMQRLFGKEMRNLQNIRDDTPRKRRSTATFVDVKVVPKPKTAERARRERAQEQEEQQ